MHKRVGCLLIALSLSVWFGTQGYSQNKFVYSNNGVNPANTVSSFSLDMNGALAPVLGSPFATGGTGSGGLIAIQNIEICQAHNFLYASNHGTSDVSGFTIDPATGALVPVPGSPFATNGDGELGIGLACTPDDKFLFAANSMSNDISIFRINADGSLTLTGAPVSAGGIGPLGMKVTPGGQYLIVDLSNSFSRAINVFSIGANGSITPVSGAPFPVGVAGLPTSVAINCAGTLVFASDQAIPGSVIEVFSLTFSGRLVAIPGSPFAGRSSGDAFQVLLTPNEKFLFVTNFFSNTITAFAVAANGSLTELPGSPFANTGGSLPSGLGVDSEGKFLYVTNLVAKIGVFGIAADGSLTAVAGSPFDTFQPGSAFALIGYPKATCVPSGPSGPPVTACIKDDSSGFVLRINSSTGQYEFDTCTGPILSGIGTLSKKGCLTTLQHNASDRRVTLKIDDCQKKASASVQIFSTGRTFTIIDRNTADSSCACN